MKWRLIALPGNNVPACIYLKGFGSHLTRLHIMPVSFIFPRLAKLFLFIAKFFIFLLFTIFCSQYFRSNYYSFAKPAPFSGSYIYNPYSVLRANWLKSNFHAHTKAWMGLTNGYQTTEEVMSHYKNDLKYDVSCISNYSKATQYLPAGSPLYFPVYEHGYNLMKVHQLVFGTKDPCYFDIGLWQLPDNKQYIINHLNEKASLISLNHPSLRNGYTRYDLQRLSGYQLMEVLNNYRNNERLWDVALSAGKLSWIIANDDCHDIRKPDETGIAWTMVNVSANTAPVFLEALKNGRCYGVTGNNGVNNHYLKEVTVTGNTINIRLDSKAGEIKLVGQNGAVKKLIQDSDSISYTFGTADSYIRADIKFPGLTMMLNPLVRYNGKDVPVNTCTALFNPWKTFLIRLLLLCTWLSAVFMMYKRFRRKRNYPRSITGKKPQRPVINSGSIY